jgi:tetratricopeptide (TPR) repeat protein
MTRGKHIAMLDKLLLAACTAAIGAFLINQIYDLDIWWHIVIGRDIMTRHAVPVTDHFSVVSFGHPYHDSQWLFQVAMALADRIAGMAGAQVLMILGWAATFWFCHRAIMRHTPMHQITPLPGTLLLFLAAMASTERFIPRPDIVTLLMVALLYWLLQERKYLGAKGLLLFGLLQVIWTNAHGLFVIGPFMAGCYWFAAALRRTRGDEPDFMPLTRLLGVLALATLISPYGWEGWRFAAKLASEVGPWAPGLFKTVYELSPTYGAETRSGIAFWFFASLLAATILTVIPLALRRQISLARLLIVAGLLAAALTGRRNMPLFALVAAPFVAENLRLLFPQNILSDKIKTVLSAALALAMLGWAWYPLSGAYYMNMSIPSRFGWGATPSIYPHELPQILERSGFNGQIYNSHSLGGFYMYHGYPQRLPLTDGRFELYDTKTLETIFHAPRNPASWARVVSTYDIRGLLLQHTSSEAHALLPMLQTQGGWRLAYYDHAASFWIRSDMPHLLPAINLASATLPPKPARPEDCFMLNEFLHIMGADELELQNLQRALGFGWEMESLLAQTGRAQIRLQRFDQAESTLGRLLHDYPNNLDALVGLGLLAENKNDFAAAEKLLHRALKIAPDNTDIRNNHLRIKAALGQAAVNRTMQ